MTQTVIQETSKLRTTKQGHDGSQALVPKKGRSAPKGNQNALKHGVWSRSAVKNRTRAVRRAVNKLYEVAPWLTESDLPVARMYCEVERIRAEIFVPLSQDKPYREVKGDLIPRKLLTEYRQLTDTSLKLATALGLTPGSRAGIGVSVATGRLLKQRLAEEYHHL
jgi:phage terminase small subunit